MYNLKKCSYIMSFPNGYISRLWEAGGVLTALVHCAEQIPVMVKLLVLGGISIAGVTIWPINMIPALCAGASVV